MAENKKPTSGEVKKKVGNAYVLTPFRDINDFEKKYEIDQDVSDLSKDRIDELVKKGLVAIEAEPAKPVV